MRRLVGDTSCRRLQRAQRAISPLRLLLGFWLTQPALASPPPVESVGAFRLREINTALQQQPLVEAERQRLMAELAALRHADPASETSIKASYLLGRLRQLYGEAEEPPEFLALLMQHPQHPLAQLARMKLMLRRLYALDDTLPEARLEAAEQMGRSLTLPSLQCDFHLALGDAYLLFGDQCEPALRHLAAAEQLGITSSATRGTVLVQIGELARLTGDKTLAVRSYRIFLKDFPRDIRQQIVRARLASVEAQP